MINIDCIYDMLSWHNDEFTQLKGIEYAKECKYLYPYILPILPQDSKSVWENCARVLASKDDSELKPYLCELFMWFQDMNWPGATIIFDRLLDFKSCPLTDELEISIKEARYRRDNPWESALVAFKNAYFDIV